MGFFGGAADRIRAWMQRDKEQTALQFAKGSTSSSYPSGGYDLLQAYGYDIVSDYLKLEQDLMCLSGDTKVFVLNDGPEWVPIRDLAEKYKDRPDEPIYTLSFDQKTKRMVCAKAYRPRKTKTEQVYYVVMVGSSQSRNESYIVKATANHPFLMRDGEHYKRVDELQPGDSVMPAEVTQKNSSIGCYWYAFQPFDLLTSGRPRQEKLANLVVECAQGRRPVKGEIVHHKNGQKGCDAPWNLEIMDQGEHHTLHMKEIWADPVREKELTRRIARSKSGGVPKALKSRNVGGRKPRKYDFDPVYFRKVIRESASVEEASRVLGANWWTVRCHMQRHEIPMEELGSEHNHRVIAILPAGVEDVYDLSVPGYENFAAEGVIVHNSRYVDYEEMAESALAATALEIYADDATQLDGMSNKTFWLTSPDKTVEEMGQDLFDRTLRMSEDIWSIAHNTCMYGSDFEEILVTDQGVRGLNFLPTPTMRRIEGPRGELLGFVQDFKMRFGLGPAEFKQVLAARNAMRLGGPNQGTMAGMERMTALEDWECVHFRLQGRKRRSIYGSSILDPGRFIWKRLMLLEDSALIYRLTRSAERFAFYVDTGDLPPQEALAHLNRVRQQNKKKAFINPATGKLDYKAKIMGQQDDFYVPVRNGQQGTRIEVLGAPSWQAVEDIQYFLKHYLAALKIPGAYLSQDDGATNRSSLSSQDVRFARTILRIQRELKNGGSKIFRTHLAALNIDPQQVDYTMHMTIPSAIFELAHLEVQNARADLAARMDPFVDKYFLLSNVFKLSDEEIQAVMGRRSEDAEREASNQASAASIMQRATVAAGMQGQAQGQVDMTQIMNTAGMQTPDQQAQAAQAQQVALAAQQQKKAPKKESSIGGPLIKVRDGVRPREYYGLERDLFEHSKKGADATRRLEEKMDKLLKSDRMTYERMNQMAAFLKETAQAINGNGGRGFE